MVSTYAMGSMPIAGSSWITTPGPFWSRSTEKAGAGEQAEAHAADLDPPAERALERRLQPPPVAAGVDVGRDQRGRQQQAEQRAAES